MIAAIAMFQSVLRVIYIGEFFVKTPALKALSSWEVYCVYLLPQSPRNQGKCKACH